jgi:hypothetical protein
MTYYIEQDNKIVLHDTDMARLERTLKYMPQYATLTIKETQRPIENCEWADTPEYAEKKHKKELIEQVSNLEAQTGLTRSIRELVLAENSGASEFVKEKAQEIEVLAEELRK